MPNTTSAHTPPPFTTPAKFAEQVRYIQNLQRYGKGYFAINEWGAGPDYGLNRAMIPYNITGDGHRAVRQFVSAAFMMVSAAFLRPLYTVRCSSVICSPVQSCAVIRSLMQSYVDLLV